MFLPLFLHAAGVIQRPNTFVKYNTEDKALVGRIDAKLQKLGLLLPHVTTPLANYVPVTIFGSLLTVSGQLPMLDGKVACVGKIGGDVSMDDAVQAARLCALNIVAQVRHALDGDLDRVVQCLRLGGFVNSIDTFTQQSVIVNGASDLIVDVFGDAGKHARSSISVASLPLGAAVEVEAMFAIAV